MGLAAAFRESVVRRLILFIVLFSVVVTLLLTAAQIYREYGRERDIIAREMQQVRVGYLDSLIAARWTLDTQQTQLLLDGIARLRDVREVVLEQDGKVEGRAGRAGEGAAETYTFLLGRDYRDRAVPLGSLRVVVDLEAMYARLADRAWIILGGNATTIFAVSIFIFLIFQRLVTRHLHRIARYARALSAATLDRPLTLERKSDGRRVDEIALLADSINTMRGNLVASYQQLGESEARFRLLAENIDAVLWIGSADWREVSYVNPAYERIWGRSRDSLYRDPLSWLEALPPEDRQGAQRTIDEARTRLSRPDGARSGSVVFAEYRVQRPDGTIRWIAARTFPVCEGENQALRIVGIAQDITVHRRIEGELRATMEQAEIASAAKTRFLANMSHELRTPLNAVIGFAGMFQSELFGPLGHEKYREYASDIRRSGEHLLGLIGEILDVSKIESGGLELREEEVALDDLLAETARLVHPQAVKAGIVFDSRISPGLRLHGDRQMIRQITLNLLSNAIKFTAEGGRVTLSAGDDDQGEVVIAIGDTGRGIPRSELARILEPFEQVEDPMISNTQGGGLGLSIAKSLVEAHGARLLLDSQVGRGTTATVRFPACRNRSRAPDARQDDTPPARRRSA